jgi:hypothetical protein
MTRFIDRRRELNNRRLFVLRTLMATRRATISADHVNALNLIEIEYHGKQRVIDAWKDYLKHMSTPFDQKDITRITRERQTLLAKLLSAMSRVMGFKMEQLEIFEGGYYPQGAVNTETQQEAIRKMFASIAAGERGMPIEITKVPPRDTK